MAPAREKEIERERDTGPLDPLELNIELVARGVRRAFTTSERGPGIGAPNSDIEAAHRRVVRLIRRLGYAPEVPPHFGQAFARGGDCGGCGPAGPPLPPRPREKRLGW